MLNWWAIAAVRLVRCPFLRSPYQFASWRNCWRRRELSRHGSPPAWSTCQPFSGHKWLRWIFFELRFRRKMNDFYGHRRDKQAWFEWSEIAHEFNFISSHL
jgi:hypothetical protein